MYAITLAEAFKKKGVQFIFVTVDNSALPREERYEGFEVYRIADGPKWHGEFILWWNLWRLLRSLRHRFDIIHAFGSTYRNSAIGLVGKILGKKSLTTVSMAHNDLHLIGRSVAGSIQSYLLGHVDRYVSLSREITEEIKLLPLDSTRAIEIPQGVNTNRFRPVNDDEKLHLRKQLNLPDGPLALYAGVFDSRKNVKWLVETWEKSLEMFGGCRLLLVGPTSRDKRDAGLRRQLECFVRERRLEGRILFRDFAPRIEDYYRAADIFVLPSYNEGMPNVVVEAMGCGLPCVVTRISGTTDLITHGESGMLFEVNNEQRFNTAMGLLISDVQLRSQIGHRAAQLIRERFAVEKVASRYLELYQEMLIEG